VGSDWLLIGNNEKGFAENNVRALCDVARSTKANKVGYIGEKGSAVTFIVGASD
jgi:hypothetical protein